MNYSARNNILLILGIGCALVAQKFPQFMTEALSFGGVLILLSGLNYSLHSLQQKSTLLQPSTDRSHSIPHAPGHLSSESATVKLLEKWMEVRVPPESRLNRYDFDLCEISSLTKKIEEQLDAELRRLSLEMATLNRHSALNLDGRSRNIHKDKTMSRKHPAQACFN